jgi:hypothetical protein
MEWLDEIESRLKAATPGPWEIKISDGYLMGWCIADDVPIARIGTATDVRFITQSPVDIAKLMAAVRVANDTLEKLSKLRKVAVTDDIQGMAIGAIYQMVSGQAHAALAQLQRGEFGEGE